MGGYKAGVEKAGGTYLDAETQYADGVSDKAVTAMEAIIQSHRGVQSLSAIMTTWPSALHVQQLPIRLTRTPFSLAVAAMLQHSMQFLAGQETMTVAVDGYDVGYRGVQAAVDALNGKTLDKFIASTASIVTADNAEERRRSLKRNKTAKPNSVITDP